MRVKNIARKTRKVMSDVSYVAGVTASAKLISRNIKGIGQDVDDIKNAFGIAGGWVKKDVETVKQATEVLFSDEPSPLDVMSAEALYTKHMNARGLEGKDLPRLIRRSAQSVWVNCTFGCALVLLAFISVNIVPLIVGVAAFASASKHAYVNWMHRNQKYVRFRDFVEMSDWLPKAKA